ncbi:hypothetical protein SLA2020_300900 [Shorea laevis]
MKSFLLLIKLLQGFLVLLQLPCTFHRVTLPLDQRESTSSPFLCCCMERNSMLISWFWLRSLVFMGRGR